MSEDVNMRWYSTSEQMPEPTGTPVVALAEGHWNWYWSRVCYIPEKWAKSDTGWGEYEGDDIVFCEDSNECYWPEGWYEWNNDTGIHYRMGDKIICWAYVPMPTKGIVSPK